MAQKDLYKILGVPRTATDDEIRTAYRKLAHQYHPDKTGGDKPAEEKLKEINAAYNILRNSEKRAQYDRFGQTGDSSFDGAGPQSGPSGFEGEGFDTFDDLFDMLFGKQGQRRRGRADTVPGRDVEVRLGITLEEAAFGCSKRVQFHRMEFCGDCAGSGAAPGSKAETCPRCHGSGQVQMTHSFFAVTRTCDHCRGTGRVVPNPCKRCSGSGRIQFPRELEIEVPPGVEHGRPLRVVNEGEPGVAGGPRGHLIIQLLIQEHPIFAREGATLFCDVPISFVQAALGGTLRVPTLKGEAELKLPAGTQSGTQFRMRGLGMPEFRGHRQGDQIVRILVEIPEKLSRKERELLEALDKERDSKAYPAQREFADRLKKVRKEKR